MSKLRTAFYAAAGVIAGVTLAATTGFADTESLKTCLEQANSAGDYVFARALSSIVVTGACAGGGAVGGLFLGIHIHKDQELGALLYGKNYAVALGIASLISGGILSDHLFWNDNDKENKIEQCIEKYAKPSGTTSSLEQKHPQLVIPALAKA